MDDLAHPPRPAARRRAATTAALPRVVVALLAALVTASSPAAAALELEAPARRTSTTAAAPRSTAWVWPVPSPISVVGAFRAPPTPYAAGHRGVDLAAEPGATVLAAHAGTVRFAGPVAGRGVVSIDHGGGVISSIEPVDALVGKGDVLAAGDVIGTVDRGGHCAGDCVHFGVRVDGEYVSPFLFLGGLPRSVLLPIE